MTPPCVLEGRSGRSDDGRGFGGLSSGIPMAANLPPQPGVQGAGLALNHQNELLATPPDDRARRERLDWQIRSLRKRLVQPEARLAAIRPER